MKKRKKSCIKREEERRDEKTKRERVNKKIKR